MNFFCGFPLGFRNVRVASRRFAPVPFFPVSGEGGGRMDRARLLRTTCRQMRGLSRGDLRTLDGFSCVPEDGFGIFQKRFSCRCEADTAVRPLEERGTDAFFQRIHLLHHGRGGKGKLFRRFVETAVFGNGDECVQCFINHFAYTPS